MTDDPLFVVLGAGASHDCSTGDADPDPKLRPPLVENLFAKEFNWILSENPIAQTATPDIRDARRHGDGAFSIEKYISDHYASGNDPDGRRKFLALHWYLQELLYEVSRGYTDHPDNYDKLISALRRLGRPLVFITLNYDTLLDKRLEHFRDAPFDNIAEYPRERSAMQLFKLHGSINWGHPITKGHDLGMDLPKICPADLEFDRTTFVRTSRDRMSAVNGIAESVNDYRVSRGQAGSQIMFPALSAPLGGQDEVSCPKEHLELLREIVASVDAIDLLTIGYSGIDAQAVRHLRQEDKPLRSLLVVNKGVKATDAAMRRVVEGAEGANRWPRLQHAPGIDTRSDGFQTFVRSKDLDERLQAAFVSKWHNSPPTQRLIHTGR